MIAPLGDQDPGNPATTDANTPAMSRATVSATVSATATAVTARAARTTRRADMATRMPYRPAALKKATAASASLRLHEMFGESPATWENRMYGAGSCYQRVAQINGALRFLGLHDKLTELMLPVELSLGPEGSLPLATAPRQAEIADTEEQLAREALQHGLAQGTATVADAERYLRLSAVQCAKAEVARREVSRWKSAQRGER